MKYLIKSFFRAFFSTIKNFVTKKNIIIFSGITNYSYNGNSRYLFEYLSKNTDYEIYWFTRSDEIKKHIKNNGMQYLSYDNPLKLIYKSLFMKIVINDGDSYFNIFDLADSINTYRISIFHGYGPKTTIAALGDSNEIKMRINKINKFNYVNFTSNYTADNVSRDVFCLPSSKVKILGFPKMDSFYDQDYTKKCIKSKNKLKNFFDSVSNDSKLILYTPTWRPYTYNLPLLDITNFDAKCFNDYLETNNLYFIYSLHSVNKPKNIINNMSRIHYIDENYSLYDTNEMMLEADILMNDYSNTLVEFSVLARPQVFCIPDFEYYKKMKGFIDDFLDIMPGESFVTFGDLKRILDNVIKDSNAYADRFAERRKRLLLKYYNLDNNKSMESYKNFIGEIINK